jgi:hypothetical protein
MSKTSKITSIASASVLAVAFGLVSFASAITIHDEGVGDLATGTVGTVAGAELVEIDTETVLILDIESGSLAASVDADGVVTGVVGSYTAPSAMTATAAQIASGATIDSYSYIKVRSNSSDGYAAYLMMCTDSTAAPFAAVTGCRGGQNLSSGTVADGYIAPTTTGATLTGAAGAGGYWGYTSNNTNIGSTIAAPTGNYKPVPAFSASTPYGDQLLTASVPGASVANLRYSVKVNNTLAGGKTYNNWVIYTAVAN